MKPQANRTRHPAEVRESQQQPRPSMSISEDLDALGAALEHLGLAIMNHGKRLEPYLVPEKPEEANQACTERSLRSDFAGRIRALIYHTDMMSAHIRRLDELSEL